MVSRERSSNERKPMEPVDILLMSPFMIPAPGIKIWLVESLIVDSRKILTTARKIGIILACNAQFTDVKFEPALSNSLQHLHISLVWNMSRIYAWKLWRRSAMFSEFYRLVLGRVLFFMFRPTRFACGFMLCSLNFFRPHWEPVCRLDCVVFKGQLRLWFSKALWMTSWLLS